MLLADWMHSVGFRKAVEPENSRSLSLSSFIMIINAGHFAVGERQASYRHHRVYRLRRTRPLDFVDEYGGGMAGPQVEGRTDHLSDSGH